MKILKTITIGILVLGLSSLSSCKREGCTDPNSINFDTKAKKNDGSCRYQGEVVFWYGENTANDLQLNGATTLTYYVDGQVVGSSATNVYWTAAPTCGQNSSITVTKDLGVATNRSYPYYVKDQLGVNRWSGVLNFSANTCESIELIY
ncbi:hypothetical protein [Brumimicrobium sp.]|uniref:hypothetical protein n=1 Tax=Brumimicrobium sp. TaxID=2029867 RepID=UPI003A93DCF7